MLVFLVTLSLMLGQKNVQNNKLFWFSFCPVGSPYLSLPGTYQKSLESPLPTDLYMEDDCIMFMKKQRDSSVLDKALNTHTQ